MTLFRCFIIVVSLLFVWGVIEETYSNETNGYVSKRRLFDVLFLLFYFFSVAIYVFFVD